MDKFQIIHPTVLLAPYVKQYWFLTLENVQYGSQRLVPFGYSGLSFYYGDLHNSQAMGQSSCYTELTYRGTVRLIAVIFQPAASMAFFRMPMSELYNQLVVLDQLSDPDLLELDKMLEDNEDVMSNVQMIEQFLLKRLYSYTDYNHKRMSIAMAAINHGEKNIEQLSQKVCLSNKQFRRIFTESIGIHPKEFLRIKRFQQTLHLLQTKTQCTLSQLADECGYYDKSHLIRELRLFFGLTPTEFLSVSDPYSEYHSFFRSAFIDNPKIE